MILAKIEKPFFNELKVGNKYVNDQIVIGRNGKARKVVIDKDNFGNYRLGLETKYGKFNLGMVQYAPRDTFEIVSGNANIGVDSSFEVLNAEGQSSTMLAKVGGGIVGAGAFFVISKVMNANMLVTVILTLAGAGAGVYTSHLIFKK